MSVITVYEGLAGRNVTFRGIVVPVMWGGTLPNSLASAQMPVRLLMPFQTSGTEAREYHAESLAASGGPYAVDRVINDTFLFKPLAQDLFEQHIGALLDYEVAYEAAMRTNRIIGNAISIVSWSTAHVQTEYPRGGGVWYSGVSVKLKLKELID